MRNSLPDILRSGGVVLIFDIDIVSFFTLVLILYISDKKYIPEINPTINFVKKLTDLFTTFIVPLLTILPKLLIIVFNWSVNLTSNEPKFKLKWSAKSPIALIILFENKTNWSYIKGNVTTNKATIIKTIEIEIIVTAKPFFSPFFVKKSKIGNNE